MSMLDRRSRKDTVPTSAGPDEETVRLSARDFKRHHRKMARAGRRRRLRLWLAGLLVLALVAGAVWAVLFSSLLTVEGVQVTGTTALSPARVERAADVPTGRPLARVDLDSIRRRVEAIPSVRRAAVSRGWPHEVHISVSERTPVAVIDQGHGLRSLDADGVLFGSYASRPKRLPLVRTRPDTKNDALAEGGRVIAALPDQVAAKVDTVEVDSIDQITLNLRNGRKVVWGSADQSDQKAQVLAVLLKRPSSVIDVSVPASPTTR